MIDPCEISTIGVIQLNTLDRVLKVLRQTFGCQESKEHKALLKDFTENYPDYAEMVNQPYEDIVAFHTLIMMQLSSLGVTLVSAWTEPMYTGRGYYPFEAMDFDTYRDKVAHPEKIFQKSNRRRGAE